MTPQAFSFPTVGNNGMIYVPPYGLNEVIDYMIKVNPITYEVTKIPLKVDGSFEKWQFGVAYKNKIVFLPYNERNILIVDTDHDTVSYVELPFDSKGKYICSHLHEGKVLALPYGENNNFNFAVSFDVDTGDLRFKNIICNPTIKRNGTLVNISTERYMLCLGVKDGWKTIFRMLCV